jgi:predicted permease
MNTLAVLVDKIPSDDDIGAGVGYLVVFILLVLAVAFIGWSLTKHLRKVRENAEAGVFDPQDDSSR